MMARGGTTARSAIGMRGEAPPRAIRSSILPFAEAMRCGVGGHERQHDRCCTRTPPERLDAVLVGLEHRQALGAAVVHDLQLRRRRLDDAGDDDAC
jgi:hypothetical protein